MQRARSNQYRYHQPDKQKSGKGSLTLALFLLTCVYSGTLLTIAYILTECI